MAKSRKTIAVIALGAAVLLMGIIGFAQETPTQGQDGQGRGERGWHRKGGEGKRGMRGGQGRGGMRGFGHFSKLNLTDAQKEQMKQISTRFRESFKANRQDGRGKRGGGFDSFKGGTFNEAEVRAAAQARASAHVEMQVARARMMSEMYNVLTAEQKAQLAAERQLWEQKRQEQRAGRKANPGQIQ